MAISVPVWAIENSKTKELKLVGDFQLLNKRTISDEVTILNIKGTFQQLNKSKVYSLLDFLKAFN